MLCKLVDAYAHQRCHLEFFGSVRLQTIAENFVLLLAHSLFFVMA